ncbi:MAG: hypothetical protein EPN85_01875 [Bacteroidetes bacterium]|nr:MAG: hypothetical protein EPN85_01875 [Bacteroidota bacterium]
MKSGQAPGNITPPLAALGSLLRRLLLVSAAVFSLSAFAQLTLTPAELPNGQQGLAYNQPMSLSDGSSFVYIYAGSGTLPPGLYFDGAGVLAGTPTAPGTYSFTAVAATNAYGNITRDYTILINPAPPIVLSPTTLPGGSVGQPYNQTVTVSGGSGQPFYYIFLRIAGRDYQTNGQAKFRPAHNDKND